jgi:hypothetical protein
MSALNEDPDGAGRVRIIAAEDQAAAAVATLVPGPGTEVLGHLATESSGAAGPARSWRRTPRPTNGGRDVIRRQQRQSSGATSR